MGRFSHDLEVIQNVDFEIAIHYRRSNRRTYDIHCALN